MEWNEIVALSPQELNEFNEDYKDEICDNLILFNVDTIKIDINKLRNVFKISQVLLKFKDEQVKYLISELDKVATNQGIEEAKLIHSLENELKALKSGSYRGASDLDLKRENEELKIKIKNQKSNIKTQTQEIDKLKKDILTLQEELIHTRKDAQFFDRDDDSQTESEPSSKYERFTENIKQKNKHISELLSDIEVVEKENIVLKEKLSILKKELQDATEHINHMTEQFSSLKDTQDSDSEKIQTLSAENKALRNQIEDLVQQKQQQDADIESFTLNLDEKVDELKKVIEEKQLEVEDYKLKNKELENKLSNAIDTNKVPLEIIAEKDEQIIQLEKKLIEATEELEKNAIFFENIPKTSKETISDSDKQEIIEDLKSQLKLAHERNKDLQVQLDIAEQDAQSRTKQLSDLINQLRKYEEGQYGFFDVLQELQDSRKQITVRDNQITELIGTSNSLQSSYGELEYENIALREKLGLPLDELVTSKEVVAKQRKQKKLLDNLQNQIEILEDENLNLNAEIRKHRRALSELNSRTIVESKIGAKGEGDTDLSPPQADSERVGEYKQKYTEVIEENEALRKGMHEILESIRTEKEKGIYEIKCESLEQLLQLLDARHISGWYHPAMRLQAEVNTLQGTNNELRNQLQTLRFEITKSVERLKESEIEIQQLRSKVQESEDLNSVPNATVSGFTNIALTLPQQLSKSNAELVSNLNNHLIIVLSELENEIENNKLLMKKCEKSKQEMNVVKHQLGLLYKKHLSEKEKWARAVDDTNLQNRVLSETIVKLQKEFQNYLKSSKIPEGEDAAAKLSAHCVTLNRKYIFLQENEKKLTAENTKLKAEMCSARTSTVDRIRLLESTQNDLLYKINMFEKTLYDSVPKIRLEMANKTIYDLTTKYQELLDNRKNFEETNNVEELRKEVELLITEKDALFAELLELKSKVNLEMYANEETTTLNNKITKSELNEVSERQRANHLNNLYELVKGQLKKSEERCCEIENYNKIVLNENLKLQISQQELQDKLINSITKEDFNELESKYQEKENELQTLKSKCEKLINRNNIIEAELKTVETLKSNHELEFIGLKHLVLDLQSKSDEKTLIARLSSEVILARICESDTKNKLDIMKNDLKRLNELLSEKQTLLEASYFQLRKMQSTSDLKIRNLLQIIHTLRLQYLGCTPLSTKERALQLLRQIHLDKYIAFNKLQSVERQKNDIIMLQEQLNIEIKNIVELKNMSQTNRCQISEKMFEWYKDKNMLQLDECKYRRNAEFKEMQLQQLMDRLKIQDNQMIKLEEEYLKLNNLYMTNPLLANTTVNTTTTKSAESNLSSSRSISVEKVDVGTDPLILENKLFNSVTIQTDNNMDEEKRRYEEMIKALREEIEKNGRLLSLKDDNLKKQESLISDFEENIKLLNIKLNEKAALETRRQINVIDEIDLEEYNTLKNKVNNLQATITEKEETLTKYENLLKAGRDEHSLSASRFQDEIKHLKNILQQQTNLYEELKKSKTKQTSETNPNKIALEQYVNQVHALEDHMAELETSVSSLNTQLQASREESVRWKTLANNRLNSIESLRKELDDRYQEEILTYKSESDKYRNENISIKHDLTKLRMELSQKDINVSQEFHEKETMIQELKMKIMLLQNDLKISSDDSQTMLSSRYTDIKLAKELLEAENEALKKRFDQVISREKAAKAEINNLKSQLIKRPVIPVKSDRTEKTIIEQLKKQAISLQKELSDTHEELRKERALNETRKIRNAEDFTHWDKQKRWQQSAEKFKEKLAAKTEEFENIQKSYSTAKSIITRLEREKHILEGKLKAPKSTSGTSSTSNLETLEHENIRLKNDIEILTAKLEMQQYHSGGLGAAMLQDKLEAQERKIAVLELAAKGTIEVTAELERLNNQVAVLQKKNLRLEAENLELNVDIKKVTSEAPYLKEQIQHLERYIEVLKCEQHVVSNSGDHFQPKESFKKVIELEKTVLSLKRLVEKLQIENKFLQVGPSTSTNNKKVTLDKAKIDINKIKQQCEEKRQKIVELESSLNAARKRIKFLEDIVEKKRFESDNLLMEDYKNVKAQLEHKNQLLDKIKILLQKAALKEKFLQDEIKSLKQQLSQGSSREFKNAGDSDSSL